MKFVKLTERRLMPFPEPPKCPLCQRNARVGQWVLPVGRRLRTIFLHASCLREQVVDVPEDDVEPAAAQAAFERDRRFFASVGAC